MKDKAYVTPELIKWARLTSKLSIEEVAKKLGVKSEKIELWEKGEDAPTINQAEKLSKHYRRPLAVFYLPEPPEDFQTLRDFRKEQDKREYSTALTFMIREIQNKQNWLSNFLEDEGEERLPFIGKYYVASEAKEIAQDILDVLNVRKDYFTKISANENILNYWIKKIEDQRIFVSLTSNIHSHLTISRDEVRGFAISDSYAPFIYVNSDDTKNGQLFTLIHELAHLWVDSSGISAFDSLVFRDEYDKFSPIEKLCNEVAAEILMPKDKITRIVSDVSVGINTIEITAKYFRVSPYAVAVRLLNLNKIPTQNFQRIQRTLKKKYEEFLELEETKPKPTGGPNYYALQIRKNSRLFTEYVYSFYKGGRISGFDASSLLDIKISNFNKLAEKLYV
ncbi:XRE family transcriptional regulator [Tunicatimonas pelagia]|uniref:XRE family transcriptional regulator n=1 Tax=Tunicatimonas pelagia TaxID=931531 RepID=UPI002666D1D1|nr:XRE family transcriptional regulator [Tunicatimonas pelagia]WKN41124.1 XRE family transcriptional regulator [Tunicatimonas pelagia]